MRLEFRGGWVAMTYRGRLMSAPESDGAFLLELMLGVQRANAARFGAASGTSLASPSRDSTALATD